MFVTNKKLNLSALNKRTIILSEQEEDFIILNDNRYKNNKDIEKIAGLIKTYKYNVKIISINDLMRKIEIYLKKNNINLQDYTIVTVGEGGQRAYQSLNCKVNEVINIKWSRSWNGKDSKQFITNIENYSFANKKIIIIEDVIATGETLYNLIEKIEEKGGNVEKIISAIINEASPIVKKSFCETIVAAKIKTEDSKDPFWYPAIYSTRHLFYGDEEMPNFYEILNEKYFKDDNVEKEIKKMRGDCMVEKSSNFVSIKSNNRNVYAYNSILGNLTKLSDNEIELIRKIDKNEKINEEEYKEEIQNLKRKNFLKTIDDEYKLIEPILNNYKEDVENGRSITKLLLYVTGNCMLRCSYCYIDDAQDMKVSKTNELNCSKANMSWDVAKKSIDTFYEIITKNKQKKVHIRFHGGEPFLNFKVIKQSIEYINEKFKNIEVVFHTNTNALAMTDEIIDFWIKKSCYGKHSTDLEISIDGPKQCHDYLRKYPNGKGSYDKAIEVIKKLINRGYPTDKINIATTLSKYNYKHLRELIDEADKIGLKSVEINTLIFESEYDFLDRVDERVKCLIDARIYGASKGIQVTGKWFKLLERLYKPVLNYCGRMGQQFAVDLDGNVFLCTGYFRNFGNIENWEKIIKNKEYINLALRIVGQLPQCRNCEIECVCAGGCPASAESSYGSFYAKEEKECEFRKKMVKELIKNIDKVSKIAFDEVDSSYVPTLEKYRKEL